MTPTPSTKAARGRGRPPVAASDRRDYVRCTRLTHVEADALADRAIADDVSEGDILRAALAAYLEGRR